MHHDGSPDGCSATCEGPHIGDKTPVPEVCPECGGNGRACRYGCVDTVCRYEQRDGSVDGAFGDSGDHDGIGGFDYDRYPRYDGDVPMGRLHHNPYSRL